jgi:hypothetical protein
VGVYKHKPTKVEAFQYDGDFKTQDGNYYVPKWAVDALVEHHVLQYRDAGDLYIVEEGPVLTIVEVGDFIVNDDGFIYVLQEEHFLNLFEKVEENVNGEN